MNIFDRNIGPGEATVKYLDGDFVVLKPGTFVRCAITGQPIEIDDLKYWNVDTQEAYVDVEAAYKAYQRDHKDAPR